MNWNLILFVVFPYVAIVLAIVGTVYRWTRRPFTVSSVSSQSVSSVMPVIRGGAGSARSSKIEGQAARRAVPNSGTSKAEGSFHTTGSE